MMAINTHGINIRVEDLESTSKSLIWCKGSSYHEIFYDPTTGEVWDKWHPDENHWEVYSDPDVVKICNVARPRSAQWIADKIKEEMDFLRGERRGE